MDSLERYVAYISLFAGHMMTHLTPGPSVSLTVLHTISMGATVYRYYERWRRRALWFDDFTALAAMIMDGFLVITLWSWMDPDGSLYVGFCYESQLINHLRFCSFKTAGGDYFLVMVHPINCGSMVSQLAISSHSQQLHSLTSRDRFARISLALAIARIYPPGAKYRRLAIIESIVFFLFGLELVLHLIITCAHDTSWVHSPSQQCDFGEDLGLASLSCEASFPCPKFF